MFLHLGNFVARRWLLVIVAWLVLAVGLHRVAPTWDEVTQDGDLAYLPAVMSSVRAEQRLSQAFPDDQTNSQLALFVSRLDAPLSEDDKLVLERLVGRFNAAAANLPVTGVWTPNSEVIGTKLLQRHAALAVVSLSTEFLAVKNIEVLDAANRALAEIRAMPDFPPGLELGVTGSAAIGGDTMASARDSIKNIELWTILLVVAILAVVYRSPLLVLVPLVTIGVSVVVASDIVALLTQVKYIDGFEWLNLKVFKTTRIFVVTLLFGAGTDFCLFLISRYKEELARGLSRDAALAAALSNVGAAITASAFTTIFGLSMLLFASFGKFSNSGPTIGLCLTVALLACLTLAPALMRAFGLFVFWPGFVAIQKDADAEGSDGSSRFWRWAADHVVTRPGLILVTSVALLAPLAYAGLDVPISYNLIAELDPNRPSVVGGRLLRQHFPAGETSPIVIVVQQANGLLDTKDGEQAIARLTRALHGRSMDGDPPDTLEWRHLRMVSGVTSVRSITEPLGDQPGLFNPVSVAGRRKIAAMRNPRTKARFISQAEGLEGQVTRFEVVLAADPFSTEATATLTALDHALSNLANDPESVWHDAEFDFSGVTSGIRDLKAVTESDQRLIQALVVLSVLAVLVIVLRRPMVCLYLILSVLFSYFVTIGTTELVFAWLYPPFQGLDWKVPIFLFVILIAVGEDYNIYLATRVFEEQRRRGPIEGLRVAVEKTGGIITSCGVIMAGTFLSMMTGSLRGMLEMGFALTLGVMLDTLIVRPILVPAFLALVYRRQAQSATGSLSKGRTSSPLSTDDADAQEAIEGAASR